MKTKHISSQAQGAAIAPSCGPCMCLCRRPHLRALVLFLHRLCACAKGIPNISWELLSTAPSYLYRPRSASCRTS